MPPDTGGGGWTQPPPTPKKRRLTWLWILIPVLLVFLASVVIVIVFAVKAFVGPVAATNDYYANLRDGRYTAAYSELCSSLRQRISQTDFVGLEQSDERTKGRVSSYDFHSSELQNDDAITTGTVERGGSAYNARITLRKEGGDWKVCSVRER